MNRVKGVFLQEFILIYQEWMIEHFIHDSFFFFFLKWML